MEFSALKNEEQDWWRSDVTFYMRFTFRQSLSHLHFNHLARFDPWAEAVRRPESASWWRISFTFTESMLLVINAGVEVHTRQ